MMRRRRVLLLSVLFINLYLLLTRRPAHEEKDDCDPSNCIAPDCFCPSLDVHSYMQRDQRPQIVLFTFDDLVNSWNHELYKELFTEDLLNPNGCPISATFYVTDDKSQTEYDKVKDLYDRGHEIGIHTLSHKYPVWFWQNATDEELVEEFVGMRKKLIENAGIPKEDIKGLRCPFLGMAGDRLMSMMRTYGISYDSSVLIAPSKHGGLFPFTLDFSPFKLCKNSVCPKSKFPGIWEIPINRWYGPYGGHCDLVDYCANKLPDTKEKTLEYLRANFQRFYKGNRAPFGVFQHSWWFKSGYPFEAVKEFIRELVKLDDVYIVSAYQAIQWIKDPQTLETAHEFAPWQISCNREKNYRLRF